MNNNLSFLTDSKAQGFIGQIEPIFRSIPHLPQGIIKFLVSIIPWLALIGGIGSVYSGARSLLFWRSSTLMLFSPFAHVPRTYITIAALFQLATGILLLLAFKLLQQRKLNGWIYLFWTQVLSVVLSLVGLVFGPTGLFGAIIGAFIGFYLIFELKPSYK